jgi:Glycogen synthase.
VSENAILVSTSGRYEYRNKGLDIFIDAMGHIRTSGELQREIIAFIMVPGHVYDARADLKEILKQDYETKNPLQAPFVTHWLYDMEHDKIISHIRQAGFTNNSSDKIKIIFVPCYLSGSDGIFNTPYYDLLIGMDATVYPSYYEPWGYTPMESIAFGIPTITTNLAGFGLWAKHFVSGNSLSEGVMVLERTDFNYFEVTDSIAEAILELSRKK